MFVKVCIRKGVCKGVRQRGRKCVGEGVRKRVSEGVRKGVNS